MIDKFIEYILKKNRPLGIILIIFVVLIFLVEVVNNFVQIGQLASNPLWLPVSLAVCFIFGIAIGWDSEGYYSRRTRKLARLLVFFTTQTLVLLAWDFIRVSFYSYGDLFVWGWTIFMVISSIVFIILERNVQKPSPFFNVLFFEFSDGGNEEKSQDRSITEFVQQGLRKRFEGTKIRIIPIGIVIKDDTTAKTRGINARVAAVIWGIYTKRLKNIILRLGFEVIKRPEYYQHVELGMKVLPLEELDTGHLDILIENDYANVINFLIGLSEYSSGNFEAAITTFSSLLTEAKNIASFSSLKPEILLLHLGNSYYSSKDIDKSKYCFEQALIINQNNPKALHNIGVIEYQIGRIENSIKRFSEAISLDSELFVAYRNRAFAFIQKGNQKENYERALEDLSKCLELKPLDIDALKLSAICYSHLGEHYKAIKHFELAHKFSSRDMSIVFDLADEYIRTNNLFKAFIFPISQLLKGKHPSLIFGYLGQSFGKLSYKRFAEVCYVIAILFSSNKQSLYYTRSRTRRFSGSLSLAEKDLEKVIQIDPQMTRAYLDLGDIQMQQNKCDKAKEYYSIGISLPSSSPVFYRKRAEAAIMLGEYHEAIDDCENHVRITKSVHPKILQLLTYCYAALADHRKAKEYADKAYQLSPTDENKDRLYNILRAFIIHLLDTNGDANEILHFYKTAQNLKPGEILFDEEYEQRIIALNNTKKERYSA